TKGRGKSLDRFDRIQQDEDFWVNWTGSESKPILYNFVNPVYLLHPFLLFVFSSCVFVEEKEKPLTRLFT
ncbi:MAG: hypothetical protein ACRD82_02455, partial [Blastocatellia bacterium]